ncbi:hypothetical protein [Sphingomonas faeni]|uniref:hypothetical protein n=1 Tax=Sphingomonas faeni TaxID=185950 RepID=UPI003359E740
MKINTTALRIAAVCLLSTATPVWAGAPLTCVQSASKPRLMCDEGACIRVSVKDLCEAVRASYPAKRRNLKPLRTDMDPVRDELTLLIASVS